MLRLAAATMFIPLVMMAGLARANAADSIQHQLDQRRLFQKVGEMYNLDPDLLEAIARVESNGNSQAISPKGAQGLMQLMPATARRFRVSDPFDVVENALGAARFLDHLRSWQTGQSDFNVFLPEFLAAYNAGEGAVNRYKGVPPYDETQSYVRKVLWTYLFGSSRSVPASVRQSTASAQPKVRSEGTGVNDTRLLDQLAQLRQDRATAESRAK